MPSQEDNVSSEGRKPIGLHRVVAIVITLAAASMAASLSSAQSENAARFNPTEGISGRGIAVDRSSNVYVSDSRYNVIRKIAPNGEVSTLAGLPGKGANADGTGSNARFNGPDGLALDSMGNFYVADSNNHAIRKITPAGVVSTLAADAAGTLQFHDPHEIAVDSGGNVYLTDGGTVRKITSAGAVSTLAVLPDQYGRVEDAEKAAGRVYSGGVAVDRADNLYAANRANNAIYKITSEGALSTLAGTANKSGSVDGTGNAARFYLPDSVASDSANNLYLADAGNETIRKITPGGVVSTFAGSPQKLGDADGIGSAARFYGLHGIAVDGANNVYVMDHGNVRKITPAGVVSTLDGLYEKDDVPGAIADYTHAIKINPSNRSAYNSRGKLRLSQGDFAGAIADFEAALRFKPGNQVYQENLARANAAVKGR